MSRAISASFGPDLLTLGAIALGAVAAGPAVAAPPVAGFVGSAPSTVAGCPNIAWRLARHDNGQVTGIAYYSDLSGVSMVQGTIDRAGKFHLNLTSSMGNGPVGTVDGTRASSGVMSATLRGQGCANMNVRMQPVEDMARYNEYR